MSAIAYAYSIYPYTHELVQTITERRHLTPDTPSWHRLMLRDRFERHVSALTDAVLGLTPEALRAEIASASLQPGKIDPAAVRRVIAADPYCPLGTNESGFAFAFAFAETLAAGLSRADPADEAMVRDIILYGPQPFLAIGTVGPHSPTRPEVPATPGSRLEFEDQSRIVSLDSVPDASSLPVDVYWFLKAIGAGERCGSMIPGSDIQSMPGLAGKKLSRIIRKLPKRWTSLVASRNGAGGGYCLTLPPKTCP
ncbi:hypothetical protein J8F10_16390 [Gemmata sp. G18]|uniref:OmpR/PhoB-type domain-containing protein n=1 Tax=Gemmata palustris TaxID=2822762 RepID=A0ABS5BSZ2_9BACT|nr:hypothetical protein [Gemmata palustris]MBP3956852.1 hypothetical protein [Gemmata palustris]